ncbi:MAG: hypothetical protein Q9M28_06550 [Mariprofundaceae bacterium]|nr:hypothetical protein [Mariprofundaceae bacterium]
MIQILCFLILCLCPLSWVHADSLNQTWKESRQGVFVQPSQYQVEQATQLFFDLFTNNNSNPEAWESLGMKVKYLHKKGQAFIVIQEQNNQYHGRGFFAIRSEENHALLLQAPHAFKDLHTGRIALKLFQKSHAKAAAWNTVPRHYFADSERVDADLAHRDNTFFTAFSHAFIQAYPQGKTLQLHGFSQKKRQSISAQQADMILSSGQQYPSRTLQNLAHCLKRDQTQSILIYPTDVQELGGTTNVIAKYIVQQRHHSFIHLEMSFETRKTLRHNTDMQHALLQCL